MGRSGDRPKSGWQLSRPRNLFLCGSFSGTLQNSILIPTKQESGPESSREAAAGRAFIRNPGTGPGFRIITMHRPGKFNWAGGRRESGPVRDPAWLGD